MTKGGLNRLCSSGRAKHAARSSRHWQGLGLLPNPRTCWQHKLAVETQMGREACMGCSNLQSNGVREVAASGCCCRSHCLAGCNVCRGLQVTQRITRADTWTSGLKLDNVPRLRRQGPSQAIRKSSYVACASVAGLSLCTKGWAACTKA